MGIRKIDGQNHNICGRVVEIIVLFVGTWQWFSRGNRYGANGYNRIANTSTRIGRYYREWNYFTKLFNAMTSMLVVVTSNFLWSCSMFVFDTYTISYDDTNRLNTSNSCSARAARFQVSDNFEIPQNRSEGRQS